MKIKYISMKPCLIIAPLVGFSGCAHNIQLTPDLEKLRNVESISSIDKNVAYYISKEDKIKEVTTPGGGGDKVTYKPYADSESALNAVLSRMFSKVYSIKSLEDKNYIKEKDISFIFIPKITTNSSSSSAFTWPPTEFTISLSSRAIDAAGKTIWEKTLDSKGNAEFSEFKSDFSLAARRASESVFINLLEELEKEKLTFK
jgi:hypothetical protein